MSINPNLETFKALHDFSTYKGPIEKLLKVAKDKNGREYLKFVDKKEFTLQERISSLFGNSSFNLKNVLNVATNAARERLSTDVYGKKPQDILHDAATLLNSKVVTHYKSNTSKKTVINKISQIKLLPLIKSKINEAKDEFLKEVQSQNEKSFLRENLNSTPGYQKLHDMWETGFKECELSKPLMEHTQKAETPASILQAIVEHLETNTNPRIQEIGEAIMSAVAIRSGENSPVKDPAAFTTAAFLLRQIQRIHVTLPPDQQKNLTAALKKWQKIANNYSLQKPVDEPYKRLLDRLGAALIGESTLIKAALSDPAARTEKIIEIFTTDSPLKAPLERICQKQHCSENFTFLNDFLAWNKSPQTRTKEGAQELINKYIAAGADLELNISPDIRKKLQELMKDYEGNSDAVQAQLQKAMNEVIYFLVPNILGTASGGK